MEGTLAFDHICFTSDQTVPKGNTGKLKLAPAGLGWKDGVTGTVHTDRIEDIVGLQWLRATRGGGFQLRIELAGGEMRVFEGFNAEAAPALADFCRRHYNAVSLRMDEGAGRGWNWGRVAIDETRNETRATGRRLAYSVAGKLAFDLPLKHLSNALVAAKNELVLEFATGANCVPVDDRDDIVTEIRFYIPDAGKEIDVDADNDNGNDNDNEAETDAVEEERMNDPDEDATSIASDASSEPAENAAETLLTQIRAASNFSEASGEVIAALPELACVVPRGRYRVDMFATFLRLHGKSYDYKIDYGAIQKLFLLPKSDDAHVLLVLALDPPLRQGQTRYPHLVIQFPKEERIEHFTLQSTAVASSDGKLQSVYENVCTFELASMLLRSLAGQKVVVPGAFKSASTGHPSVKCAIKANEGVLYPLEKNLLFLPKPTLLLPHADISKCVFVRVGGPASSFGNPRSFDLRVTTRTSIPEHLFSNISKDELDGLVDYLRGKQIPFSMEEESHSRKKGANAADVYLDTDEESDGKRVKTEDGDEEEDSTDEDYIEGASDDEDSDASASASDDEDDDEDDEDEDEDDEDEDDSEGSE